MKQAIRDGEISIEKLISSKSEERRGIFEKFVPTEIAQEINAKFEKAIISNRATALQDWAKSVFKPHETAKIQKLTDKIKELNEDIGSGDAFYRDLIAEQLGVTVTPEEFKTITEKGKKVEDAFSEEKLYDKDGLIRIESIRAKKELDDYLNSLSPTHNLKVATSIIGRGNMLLALPPAILNATSNAVQGAQQYIEKRLARVGMDVLSGESISLKSANIDFAKKYVKRALDIYRETGYDITRLEMSNKGELIYFADPGTQKLGEDIIHSEGKGLIRKYGRFTSKVVFKYLLGFNDAISANIQAMDSASLDSMRRATKEGLKGEAANKRALEILKDSVRLQPATIEGQMVKSQSITDARTSTWTNKSWFTKVSLGLRNYLNSISGDLSIGDNLMPFVVTGANVVSFQLDSAGLGVIKGTYGLLKGAKTELANGNPEPMQQVIRQYVRAGMGITLSVILANMFDPDDFVSAYESVDNTGKDLVDKKNAPYNSIKIGDKWISLDYFGALGSGFVGAMYARKYGKNPADMVYQYVRGATGQALQTPGIREIPDMYDSVAKFVKQQGAGNKLDVIADDTINFIRARTIPAVFNNISQGTDEYARDSMGSYAKAKSGVPFVRRTLPEKIDQTTGQKIKGEGFWTNVLFGSRIKTANENKVIKEISRLEAKDLMPAISDIQRLPRVQEFKTQVSEEKYQEAIQFYGEAYGKLATGVISTEKYTQTNNDEAKRVLLNNIRENAVNAMLAKYKYKPNKYK